MLPSPPWFNVPGADDRKEERHEATRLYTANVPPAADPMVARWVVGIDSSTRCRWRARGGPGHGTPGLRISRGSPRGCVRGRRRRVLLCTRVRFRMSAPSSESFSMRSTVSGEVEVALHASINIRLGQRLWLALAAGSRFSPRGLGGRRPAEILRLDQTGAAARAGQGRQGPVVPGVRPRSVGRGGRF